MGDPFFPTERPLTGFGRKQRSAKLGNNPNQVTDDYYSRGASYGYDDLQQQKFEKYSVPAMVVESAVDKQENGNELEDDEEYNQLPTEDDFEENNNQYTLNDIKSKKPNNMATARFSVYKGLEKMMSR